MIDPRVFLEKSLREFNGLMAKPALEAKALLKPIMILRHALTRYEEALLEGLDITHSKVFQCFECKQAYREDYMVHDHVWQEAVDWRALNREKNDADLPKGGIYLHLACLEKRLGRRLTLDDLKDVPCNAGIRYFSRTA